MSTPSNDLPKLFGSLKPSAESVRDHKAAAAQEAQQRWPLLRSVSPEASFATPALSEDERGQWNAPAYAIPQSRSSESPTPPFNQALARSLDKMSTWAPPSHRPTPPSEALQASPPLTQAPEPDNRPAPGNNLAKPTTPLVSAEPPPVFRAEGRTDEKHALASVFSRLEGKAQRPAATAQPKPSSFMSRIGKR